MRLAVAIPGTYPERPGAHRARSAQAYLGEADQWAFAIWQASRDSSTDAVLLNGQPAGHPSEALDTACTLYLADTGGQPAEPLNDLRGAALVEKHAT